MPLSRYKTILSESKTIAIIGAKDKPGQPVDRVGRYLIAAGYTVIPVHPKRENVWGLPTHTSLSEVPGRVDIVDVFRAPEFCLDHAREAVALAEKPRLFWMQAGIENAEARALLAEHGVPVVENACLMVEHLAMFG